MTVVEFYDGVAISNMISCLAIKPERVVFVGDKKAIKDHKPVYERFVQRHNLNIEFSFRPVDRNKIDNIIDVLTDIVQTQDEYIFDLTGGDDLVLVAMGVVYEKYKDSKKILMHRINITTGSVADCDRDGILAVTRMPKLSVEDNIMIYGGDIAPFSEDGGTYAWDFNDDFVKDVKVLWDICREKPWLWNTFTTSLGCVAKDYCPKSYQLEFAAKKPSDKGNSKNKADNEIVWVQEYIREFLKHGFIRKYREDKDGNVSFSFRDAQIKRCLTKAGTVLELITSIYCSEVENKDGRLFDDVATGVMIDWDAEFHAENDVIKDTENEIDVILMHGLVPVFVSCKNGQYDDEALYKLETVAGRFGGPYAKKVLISTYYGKENNDDHEHFVQRAKDMDIQLIQKAHKLTREEFLTKLRSLRL